MSQASPVIADQAGASFLTALNAALMAIVTQNSGALAPNPTYANQWWADTTNGILKYRDAGNANWIPFMTIATGLPYGTGTPSASTFLRGDGSWASASGRGVFLKSSRGNRLFTSPTATTVQAAQQFYVDVAGTLYNFASGTNVVMPTLTAGTDYAFYACTDSTLRADASFTAPTGYTTSNSRYIGCGHYAPGGNASAMAGGNTTPAFNPYSLFDLTYHPDRRDWRGMTVDPGESVCGMIYLLNQDHIINGPSSYNKVIADGNSPPKIPTQFGGSGSSAYSDLNWWTAREVLAAYGMRHPTHGEYSALAYGSTENTSIGSDQNNTILNAAYTSKCGLMQATGVMWVWGADFGGGAAAAGWTNNNGGRGQTYQLPNAAIFGGAWDNGANAGSRASNWNASPSTSASSIGARGVCDLLILD